MNCRRLNDPPPRNNRQQEPILDKKAKR